MTDWWGFIPFGVDDGELDELDRHVCFTLGVEWQRVFAQAVKPAEFTETIHASNRERIETMLKHLKREFRITFMSEDVSESWLYLSVKEKLNEDAEGNGPTGPGSQ